MRTIKLTMQGFGSYGAKPQVIDFTEPAQNIFLITGDTGSGKSTIFDAIVFALYGESASEDRNKKGAELQSQFGGYDVVPFVELEFTEREGDEERVYKVRRTPAHTRYKERGRGTTKGNPEVCLTLPDGSVLDRPASLVDERIAKVVKLDKSQFKKVAMLAQGEFLAMLSASSKEKKQIFRGIFNTAVYGDIENALARRRGSLKQDMDSAFAAFRASVAQISASFGGVEAEKLQALADGICASEALDPVYAEELIEVLAKLTSGARAELEHLGKQQQETAQAYREAVEALQKGKELSRSFEQLEKAEGELERCKLEEEGVAAKSVLAERIDAAFDIASANTLYAQAEEGARRDSARLAQLRRELPGIEGKANAARAALSQAEEAHAQAHTRSDSLKLALDAAVGAFQVLGASRAEMLAQQEAFLQAKEAYETARDAYEGANAAYLDSQAGYVARELEEGKPCPVCGSLDHPRPHAPVSAEGTVTPAELDVLKHEYDSANEAQVTASAQAGHATEAYQAAWAELEGAASALESGFASDAEGLLSCIGSLLAADSASLDVASLRNALKAAKEHARAALQAAQGAEDAAASALDAAKREDADIQTCHQVALQSISEIETSLPKAQKAAEELKASLERLIDEKGEFGKGWEKVAEEHSKPEVRQLREEVDSFNSIRAKAQGAKATAEEVIGKSKPPDMSKLDACAEEAKAKMDSVYARVTELSATCEANARALQAIEASFEEWKAASREFGTADELCRRLSGTKTGERMDLETFVQRYYFRQILHDANRRLREMTNKEYEFRMVDEQNAGSGSNKGLDLMVYSATNDNVRDIKTLSGGESFMAALAFALGLSDQIMAKKSAVNLDIMFIDEGFGSLDDNARKLAVDTLRSMTGDGRMIGIISHVAELAQVIDDRLVVTKDLAGSHARWHTG